MKIKTMILSLLIGILLLTGCNKQVFDLNILIRKQYVIMTEKDLN